VADWFDDLITDFIQASLATRASLEGGGRTITRLLDPLLHPPSDAPPPNPIAIRDRPLMTVSAEPGPPPQLVAILHGTVPLLGDNEGFVHGEFLLDPSGSVTSRRSLTLELSIEVPHQFKATFGVSGGSTSSGLHGGFLFIPLGIGGYISVFVDGSNWALDVGVDWGVPVPFIPPFVGFTGMHGLVVDGMVPRTTDDDTATPAAPRSPLDTAKWVADQVGRPGGMTLDAWRPAPRFGVALGFGFRLVSLPDSGWALLMDPVGFFFGGPPLMLALYGAGRLIGSYSWEFKAAITLIFPLGPGLADPTPTDPMPPPDPGTARSGFAFYGQIDVKYPASRPDKHEAPDDLPSSAAPLARPPPDPSREVIGGGGTLELCTNPWTLHIGTPHDPVYLSIFWGLLRGEFYIAGDEKGWAGGLSVSVGMSLPPRHRYERRITDQHAAQPQTENEFDKNPDESLISFSFRIGLRGTFSLSFRPPLTEADLHLFFEFRLRVLVFHLGLVAEWDGGIRVPQPAQAQANLRVLLELPWPLPDIDLQVNVTFYDDPTPPALRPALLAGSYQPDAAADPDLPLQLTGIHPISGRQWTLGSEAIWPDADLVVPFSEPVLDQTGMIAGDPIAPRRAGIYDVTHKLETLSLWNIDTDVEIRDFGAVWAGDTNGSGAQLHVLASDPFSFLCSQPGPAGVPPRSFSGRIEQSFGRGPSEPCPAGRRFRDVIVDEPGELIADFDPQLRTRVYMTAALAFRFAHHDGTVLFVQDVEVLLVSDVLPSIRASVPVEVALERTLPESHLGLFRVSLRPAGPISSVMFTLAKESCLVALIRYSTPPSLGAAPPGRTILTPGNYAIRVQGRSHAHTSETRPDGTPLPDPEGNVWQVERLFTVTRPDSLRPYVGTTAVGDDRIFRTQAASWNPTPHGAGFPAYRSYAPAIRFQSAYISTIFGDLTAQVVPESGPPIALPLRLRALPEGDSSLLPTAQAWIRNRGGTVRPDEEAVSDTHVLEALPPPARRTFTGAQFEVRLDPTSETPTAAWRGLISRFRNFTDHVRFDPPHVRTLFAAAGARAARTCRVPPAISKRRLHLAGELAYPPATWLLPTAATDQIGALDATSGPRFFAFAQALDVSFDASRPAASPLSGLAAPVDATVLDAVVDDKGRVAALWLRTPEPLDWRRVAATLQIEHVVPADGCPDRFADRPALALDCNLVPSPDACSVFVVGSLRGVPTCVPRGVVTLRLRYAAMVDGLASLRLPGDAVEEIARTTFVLAEGADWPTGDESVTLTAGDVERLIVRSAGDDDSEVARILREIGDVAIRRLR
jgi:hypothetical protein